MTSLTSLICCKSTSWFSRKNWSRVSEKNKVIFLGSNLAAFIRANTVQLPRADLHPLANMSPRVG